MYRRTFLATSLAAAVLPALGGCASRFRRDAAPLDAAAFHATRRYARTDHGHIAYVERGIGPAALFLHGFPLNGYQWRGALERLAPYRRCIAPDFLGLGYTRVAAGQDVSPAAQVAMLGAFLDRLQIEHVDLVANDSGGAVAQLFVAAHPQRVRSLLITNCDTEFDSPPPALAPIVALAKQGKFADAWLAPWYADHALARSPEGLGGLCYADPTQPTDAAIETYLAPLLQNAQRKALVDAYAIALDRNALAGIGARLRRCRVPVRILWGQADSIFRADGADTLARSFPAARGVRALDGAKLFWPEERPDVIAEEALALWPRSADLPFVLRR